MGKTHKDGSFGGHRKSKYAAKKEREEKNPAREIFDDLPEVVIPKPRIPRVPQAKAHTAPTPAVPGAAKPEGRTDTKVIATETFRGDGKIFYLDAVENDRGKALRIAEVSKGKRTVIMVPPALLAAFEAAQAKITPLLIAT